MLVLGDYLPYLLNRAGSRIAASYSEVVRCHGITLPMWRVLAALREREPRTVGELAAVTSIEVSTLSRVLDGMERKGLVRRRRASGDGRRVTLQRTAAGSSLTEKLVPLALRYEAVALGGLSEAEVADLKRLLVRLYDNMAELEDDRRQERLKVG
jgi:DNA-binding MarR family transcriptional regulator